MQSQNFNIAAFITIQVLQLKVKCLIYIKYILIHWLYFLHSIVFMNGLDSGQGERESKYGILPSHQITNHELADTGVGFEIYER